MGSSGITGRRPRPQLARFSALQARGPQANSSRVPGPSVGFGPPPGRAPPARTLRLWDVSVSVSPSSERGGLGSGGSGPVRAPTRACAAKRRVLSQAGPSVLRMGRGWGPGFGPKWQGDVQVHGCPVLRDTGVSTAVGIQIPACPRQGAQGRCDTRTNSVPQSRGAAAVPGAEHQCCGGGAGPRRARGGAAGLSSLHPCRPGRAWPGSHGVSGAPSWGLRSEAPSPPQVGVSVRNEPLLLPPLCSPSHTLTPGTFRFPSRLQRKV